MIRVASTGLVAAAALLLAGCGGSPSSGTSTSDNLATGTSSAAAAGTWSGRGPAASGVIAAASPGMLEVQSTDSQTTVTYTKTTRFSQTVTVPLAVGECVTATGTPVSGKDDALTATSVRVLSAGTATCSLQGDAQGRVRPSGTPRLSNRTPPSGAPGRRFGADAAVGFGKVTSVSGSTVIFSGTLRTGGARPTATPTSTPAARPVTVTLTASTAVTRTVAATSAAAKVGRCAAAEGKADSTGAVAATAIVISTKGPNGCSFGFGGPFRRGGGNG
jgi:hypothetical protein